MVNEKLDALMKKHNKTYGDGTVRTGRFAYTPLLIDTGIFALDYSLAGGFPQGAVTMVYGAESSGKSTSVLKMIGNAQRKYPDKVAVLVDAEKTFDPRWAEVHGVNVDELVVVEPESAEHAVDMIVDLMEEIDMSVLAIDSIPALVPSRVIQISAEDDHVATLSKIVGRLCSHILRGIGLNKRRNNAPAIVFVNQLRAKLGAFGPTAAYAYTLPGGRQPNYLASLKIMFYTKGIETATSNEDNIKLQATSTHSFKIEKSKVSNVIKNAEFEMIKDPSHKLGEGAIDDAHLVFELCKSAKLITGKSPRIRISGVEETFPSQDAAKSFIENNQELAHKLKQKLLIHRRRLLGLPLVPTDNYLLGYINPEEIIDVTNTES